MHTLYVYVGRRQSRQEQDLIKKLISLEAQLALKQTEVDSLNDQNILKQETINSLQATVDSISASLTDDRHLNHEAVEVPELERELIDLKKNLKQAEHRVTEVHTCTVYCIT